MANAQFDFNSLGQNLQKRYSDALREKRQYQEIARQAGDRFSSALSNKDLALNPGDVFNSYQTFNAAMQPSLNADQEILGQLFELAKQQQSQANMDRNYELDVAKSGLRIDPQTGKLMVGNTSATLDDLLKTRKAMADQGLSTTAIDEQLSNYGVGAATTNSTDIISQINNLASSSERNGARAVKDLYDVIDRAYINSQTTPTGPLSALIGKASKLTNPNSTAQLEKDLGEILRTIRKESTGVAFSPQEIKDLLKEIPSITQQEGNVADSLLRLKQRMLQKLSNYNLDVSSLYNDSGQNQSSNKTFTTPSGNYTIVEQ